MQRRLLDVYLLAWFAISVFTTASQLLFTAEVAEGTQWIESAGWQREIGIWHLVPMALVVQAFVAGNRPIKQMLLRSIILVSIALATNHALALASGGTGGTRIHLSSILANAVGVLIGAAVLRIERAASLPVGAGWDRVAVRPAAS